MLNLGDTEFSVGNFSMISSNFSAHSMRHSYTHISNFCINKGPFDFFGEINDYSSKISVGHDVWIGDRVSALPGVKFSNGSVIGSGSIVTKSTKPYGIYAGNPAKLIKFRFDSKKFLFLIV